MSIILAIIILGIIIFLHELGHFMTAKYYKMPVLEFAIGMGPKLFTKRIGETDYSIRMLPLGGFVNIAGMQPEENPENEIRCVRHPTHRSLYARKYRQVQKARENGV